MASLDLAPTADLVAASAGTTGVQHGGHANTAPAAQWAEAAAAAEEEELAGGAGPSSQDCEVVEALARAGRLSVRGLQQEGGEEEQQRG